MKPIPLCPAQRLRGLIWVLNVGTKQQSCGNRWSPGSTSLPTCSLIKFPSLTRTQGWLTSSQTVFGSGEITQPPTRRYLAQLPVSGVQLVISDPDIQPNSVRKKKKISLWALIPSPDSQPQSKMLLLGIDWALYQRQETRHSSLQKYFHYKIIY